MHFLRLTLILWVISASVPVFGDNVVTASAVTATPDQLHKVAAATGSVARNDIAARATDLPEGIPEAQGRSSGWLMVIVAVVLIGYQLRRKHRFLRPHRFTDL